jgi:hypothetical protein
VMGVRLPWLDRFGKSLRLHVLANVSVRLFYESMDIRPRSSIRDRRSGAKGFSEGSN